MLGGNLVYGASQWGVLAVLAKLGTPEMVGHFALALAVTAPVLQLANLNLSAVQATDARQEYAFADYRRVRLATTAVGMGIIVVLALRAYSGEVALVVLALGLAKGIEAISDIYFGLFQRHERMRTLGTSLMIKGPVSLLAFTTGLYLSGRVVWGALAMAAAWAGLLIGYDARQGAAVLAARESAPDGRPAHRSRDGRADGRDAAGRLVRLTLPLGVVALAASLIPNVPRYYIERELGASPLGIYAAMAYVLVAGQNVLTAVSGSAAPRLAGAYARGDLRAFVRLLIGVLGVAVAGGVVALVAAVVAGPALLTVLYTGEYADHAPLFVRLMVAGVFVYVAYVLWGATTATRSLRVQAPLFAATAAVAAAGSAALVPRFGLVGAATALLLACAFQSLTLGVTVALALRRRAGRAARRGPD